MLLLALLRRFPRRWWIAGAGAVVAIARAVRLRLADRARPDLQQVRAAARRASCAPTCSTWPKRSGVDVGEVYRVDASRRTTGVNAYVTGIGHTKRVVLYDNLIERFPRDQINSIVAHELGHVRHRDVPRGLLWLAIVAPAGRVPDPAADRALGAAARRAWARGAATANALALPAVALALGARRRSACRSPATRCRARSSAAPTPTRST